MANRFLFFIICSLGLSLAYQAHAFQPPLGVPDPSWGSIHPIDTQAPARPAAWPAASATGFYYVDNSHPNATDVSNTYGYPDKPRLSVPGTLSPGAYVALHGGPYTSTIAFLNINCSEQQPCWIRGALGQEPVITDKFRVEDSSYLFFENLKFSGGSNGAISIKGMNTHHIAIRSVTIENRVYTKNTSGIGLLPHKGGTIHDVVIYGSKFDGLGNWQAVEDEDFHGVNPNLWGRDSSTSQYNIWILNNTFHNISGNGVQVNGGNWTDSYKHLHHIYIGNNYAYENRQAGVGSKQASHVIISQNTLHSALRLKGGNGDGIAYQYGPDNLWIIFNKIYNCNIGIRQSSTPPEAINRSAYIVGNLIYDIHPDSATPYDASNPWRHGLGISFWKGNMRRYVVDNTIHDVHGGVNAIVSAPLHMQGNIISDIHADDYHIWLNNHGPETSIDYNLFFDEMAGTKIRFGSAKYDNVPAFQAARSQCQNCKELNPEFADPAKYILQPKAASPAVDSGAPGANNDVYAVFFGLYNIDIRKDRNGNPRTAASRPDIGAYEFVAMPPSAPMSVTVQ